MQSDLIQSDLIQSRWTGTASNHDTATNSPLRPDNPYNRRFVVTGVFMALNSTTYKVELAISDMDRHYYATHDLTLARHPSETDARLMVRLLAFALYADEQLRFGKGISSDDEPDLWRKDLTGEIQEWIELGQPDEQRIRKACGRARHVVVVNYSGRGADIWWEKIRAPLMRSKNLSVIDIAGPTVDALAALANRNMRLQCLIQDGQIHMLGDGASVTIDPTVRMAPSVPAG
jgi:uncharacterized protein YaeQ